MNTPLCDFLFQYEKDNKIRAHMPGHKGKGESERFDITEIDEADVLYSGKGIIYESELNASALFDSAKTLYSTEGSSLCIRAMLYLIKLYAISKGKKCKILAGRNAHKTFITASALLDIDVDWIFPDENEGLTSCKIAPQKLRNTLCTVEEKPTALYVTSPDYLGNITDIKALSNVCKKEGVLLIVDNAHGAYLRFLSESKHPINLGADMCCDSAHKTLPVLTGGAYLHIGKEAEKMFLEKAEEAMSLFASTSPSYLIMSSLDKANALLSSTYEKEILSFCKKMKKLKESLTSCGYTLCGDEPLKLTVYTKPYGYKGTEFAKILLKKGIVCEFSDPDYVCLMLTQCNSDKELSVIEEAFLLVERKCAIEEKVPKMKPPLKFCSPKKAVFAFSKKLPLSECEKKVLSCVNVSCPPAVPVLVSGEIIEKDALKVMQYYGIDFCDVLINE